MNIVEFAIEQTDEAGVAFIRPGNVEPFTYKSEAEARQSLIYVNGNGEDDETFRVVSRTVTGWQPVDGVNRSTDVCTCGHLRAEHSAPVGGVCIALTEENIGDDGHDIYVDNCMSFTSAV